MARSLKKPVEGKKLADTPDMVAWRQEFEEMDLEAHKARLKQLGLDDEELAEFEEMEVKGIPLEEELVHEGPEVKEDKKPVKKK
jgi:hypothetical protein